MRVAAGQTVGQLIGQGFAHPLGRQHPATIATHSIGAVCMAALCQPARQGYPRRSAGLWIWNTSCTRLIKDTPPLSAGFRLAALLPLGAPPGQESSAR